MKALIRGNHIAKMNAGEFVHDYVGKALFMNTLGISMESDFDDDAEIFVSIYTGCEYGDYGKMFIDVLDEDSVTLIIEGYPAQYWLDETELFKLAMIMHEQNYD